MEPLPAQRTLRILIIEDEEDVCQLLADILLNEGHLVETACDGLRGLELFRQKKFDAVFTDLAMPHMTGWQVAEAIKKMERGFPVVLITGWSLQAEEKSTYASLVDSIITKPFTVDEIVAVLADIHRIRAAHLPGAPSAG